MEIPEWLARLEPRLASLGNHDAAVDDDSAAKPDGHSPVKQKRLF
jgi:hypothetical protein